MINVFFLLILFLRSKCAPCDSTNVEYELVLMDTRPPSNVFSMFRLRTSDTKEPIRYCDADDFKIYDVDDPSPSDLYFSNTTAAKYQNLVITILLEYIDATSDEQKNFYARMVDDIIERYYESEYTLYQLEIYKYGGEEYKLQELLPKRRFSSLSDSSRGAINSTIRNGGSLGEKSNLNEAMIIASGIIQTNKKYSCTLSSSSILLVATNNGDGFSSPTYGEVRDSLDVEELTSTPNDYNFYVVTGPDSNPSNFEYLISGYTQSFTKSTHIFQASTNWDNNDDFKSSFLVPYFFDYPHAEYIVGFCSSNIIQNRFLGIHLNSDEINQLSASFSTSEFGEFFNCNQEQFYKGDDNVKYTFDCDHRNTGPVIQTMNKEEFPYYYFIHANTPAVFKIVIDGADISQEMVFTCESLEPTTIYMYHQYRYAPIAYDKDIDDGSSLSRFDLFNSVMDNVDIDLTITNAEAGNHYFLLQSFSEGTIEAGRCDVVVGDNLSSKIVLDLSLLIFVVLGVFL